MIQAIETKYKGYNFRSRLEARWAVFFDALGIKWEYEKEGYDLGRYGWYLPDFYLSDWKVWIEVKPTLPTDNEFLKFTAFVEAQNEDERRISESFILCGSPGLPKFNVSSNGGWELIDGYVALCPVVVQTGESMKVDDLPDLTSVKRGRLGDRDAKTFCAVEAFAFVSGGKELDIWPIYFGEALAGEADSAFRLSTFLNAKGMNSKSLLSLQYPQGFLERVYFGDGVTYDNMPLRMAYTAARSARFEHGANPQPRRPA